MGCQLAVIILFFKPISEGRDDDQLGFLIRGPSSHVGAQGSRDNPNADLGWIPDAEIEFQRTAASVEREDDH